MVTLDHDFLESLSVLLHFVKGLIELVVLLVVVEIIVFLDLLHGTAALVLLFA